MNDLCNVIVDTLFMDPRGSGIYCLDKSKHMDVSASKSVETVKTVPWKDSEGGKRIIYFTVRIIERFPDLANHLRAKPVSMNPSFNAAVKAYVGIRKIILFFFPNLTAIHEC